MAKVLETHNITKKFGVTQVLKQVNFAIYRGEIVGIIGRNGSGKTVLLKILAGLYYPSTGKIKLVEDIENKIGVLIDTGFLPNKTGLQNLLIIASLCKDITKKRCYQLLETVGLDPFNKNRYKNYSNGMKQRLALAYVLMEDPELLLLDEPFSGIDKESVVVFRNLLLSLKKNGKTILLTSHYQEDINLLCDRVFEMDNGTLVEVQE
jgi:ABC-2 type transport system ATP-binding protein